jgi:thymidine kinase
LRFIPTTRQSVRPARLSPRRPPGPEAASISQPGAQPGRLEVIAGCMFSGKTERLIERLRAAQRAGRRVLALKHRIDAWGRPFTPMPELAATADECVATTAPCARCGADARYSQRLTPIDTPFMVGGADCYEPRCARCFVPLASPAPPL